MIPALFLAIALGVQTPAAPSPDERERLNHSFDRARQVQVLTTTRAFDVTRPRALESGLDYAATPGFTIRRPSIVPGDWDSP
jgi:hypothetical protein